MQTATRIDTSVNDYSYDVMNCFEKPLGLVLEARRRGDQDLFYLHLKLLQSYRLRGFDAEGLFYTMTFNPAVRWALEERLGLRISVEEPTPAALHDLVRRRLQAGTPVLVTGNLRELPYSRHHGKGDWGHLFLVNGHDPRRDEYQIVDGEHLKPERGRLVYEPSALPARILESVYRAMQERYRFGLVGWVEPDASRRPPDARALVVDCLDLFVNGRAGQPYRERDYVDEVLARIRGVERRDAPAANNYDPTSQIDFVFTRGVKYKEAFHRLLAARLDALCPGADVGALRVHAASAVRAWSQVLSTSLISLHLKTPFDASKTIEEAVRAEEKLAEVAGRILVALGAPALAPQRARAAEPPREVARPEAVPTPRTASAEDVVRAAWTEALGAPAPRGASFLSVGGDSLAAVRVIAYVLRDTGVQLPLDAFLRDPTVEELAARVRAGASAATPVRPAPRAPSPTHPLSSAQRRVFVIEQLARGGLAYHVTIAVPTAGALDVARLERAFRALVARHEALRTSFVVRDGEPVQLVSPSVDVALERLEVAPEEVERAVREFARPFDLSRAPLVRAGLVRVAGEDRSVFVLDTHHIVVDGTSVGILLAELARLYRGEVLEDVATQMGDFAEWEARQRPADVAAHERFWLDLFAGEPPRLDLPTDFPRPPVKSFEGDTVSLELGEELAAGIRALARQERTTPFYVFVAAHSILLHRITGRNEVVVGVPVAGRPGPEFHGTVGMFVNTLPLLNHVRPGDAFRDLLRAASERGADALRHQALPFERLVEKLHLERDVSRNPLFDTMLSLLNVGIEPVELEGERAVATEVKPSTARFDLLVELREVAGRYTVNVNYATSLFRRDSAERFGRHLVNVLAAAVRDPTLRVDDLPLLDEVERATLVERFAGSSAPFSRDETVHGLFEEAARRAPAQVALRFDGPTPVTLTYAELDRRANQLAASLRALGVGRGTFAAVLLSRRPEMIVALLGVLKAGAAYVPLEPSLPDARLRAITEGLALAAVVTERAQLARLGALAPRADRGLVCVDALAPEERAPLTAGGGRVVDAAALAAVPADAPRGTAAATDDAYVIFTSGSTGTPKGVRVKHRPVVNVVEWVNRTFGVGPLDRLLFVTSMSFDLSVYDVFGVLAAGGTVHLATDEQLASPERLSELLRGGVTFWDSAPQALAQLVPFLGGDPVDAATLRLVFLSGDWIPVDLPDALRRVFPRARVIALGGATEATIWSNAYVVEAVEPWWPSIPYGKPIPNARYYVLDERLRPAPIGVPGDLFIAGECLATDYVNDPALTAEKFLPSPFVPGETMYRTGDRARWLADGNMEFLGRSDLQVKVRGYRVELGEIESALKRHPGVAEAAVDVRRDGRGAYLSAYFVPRPAARGAPADLGAQLRAHLARALPAYMVPSYLVALDRLPLTSNGKLDRKALPDGRLATADRAGATLPAGELERTIAELWKELLGVPLVGAEDSFFDLGGNSVLVIQLALLLRERLGLDVPVVTLFRHPTVRALSGALEQVGERATAAARAAPAPEEDGPARAERLRHLRNR